MFLHLSICYVLHLLVMTEKPKVGGIWWHSLTLCRIYTYDHIKECEMDGYVAGMREKNGYKIFLKTLKGRDHLVNLDPHIKM
jgi:hypothetical protein